MRTLLYGAMSLAVIVMAWWAYMENYKTKARMDAVKELQTSIADQYDYLQYLRAEWAYLTRAERLAEIVDLNFDELRLGPLGEPKFASIDSIPFRDGGAAPAARRAHIRQLSRFGIGPR